MKSRRTFNEPGSRRHCTDILFLILLIICSICMVLVGFAALGIIDSPHIKKGDPNRLLNGVDYMGNICGSNDVTRDLKAKWTPNFSGTNPDSMNNFVSSGFSICVSDCPAVGEQRSDPYGTYGEWTARIGTVNILNYCTTTDDNSYVGDLTLSFFGDFLRAISVVLVAGFFVSASLSLLFLSIIRLPLVLRGLVWSFIILVFGILAAGAFLLLERANIGDGILSRATGSVTGNPSDNKVEIQLLKAVGGLLVVAAVLWLCVICFMRDRIALAIGLVRESSKALIAMPLLCFFPLLQAILFAAFTAVWAVFFFYLASSGTVTVKSGTLDDSKSYKTVTYDTNAQHAILFMVFGWFWNIAFLEAVGQLIASHTVLTWYFADVRSKVGSGQVIKSACLISRYHLGTAAFGSFVIAVIRTLRVCLEYVKYKLKPQSTCLVKCVLCMLSCCLWCFDKCVKFLNKHAYIQCAMFGTGFCVSAKEAFQLIVRNLGRVAAITVVGDFVVLIGKIGISLSCAAAAYLYMTMYMGKELRGVVLPTVLVLFIAFSTSTLFLGVVSATADTILQAFITDEKYSKGAVNSSHDNCSDLHSVMEEHRRLKGPDEGEEDSDVEEVVLKAEMDTDAEVGDTKQLVSGGYSQRERAMQHLQAAQQQNRDQVRQTQHTQDLRTSSTTSTSVPSEKRKCQLNGMFEL